MQCTGRLDSEHILAPFCPKANDYNELTVLEMNWNWKAGISLPVEDTLKDFPSSLQLIRYAVLWANDVNVRKALNIRELRVFIYSGDRDMSIPYVSTLAWIESLNLTLEDDWKPWFSDDQVAGIDSKLQLCGQEGIQLQSTILRSVLICSIGG
ncbi:hypothetical protein DVH24_007788 [Malus domestica]|uniref:Uncharacterized protein n=1 Tax=Malus domestica TaxID=3750 RepID=A0A498JVG6_MALDO|nr:hypothetical protein DVH24_007788 [Malus domestica]